MADIEKENIITRLELRNKIIETADKAFSENGIKVVTMDDIATSLSISKRTLYETFADKETLLRECVLKRQEEMVVFLCETMRNAKNVLEVILLCYLKSIERFHNTNKQFFEDIKKYPRVHELLKGYRQKDVDGTVAFFKQGVAQGIFREDVNFEIVNLLVHEQLDLLMNSDLCKKYSFIEVYESIMFTYLRGISTIEGAKMLEDFIHDYRNSKLGQGIVSSFSTSKSQE